MRDLKNILRVGGSGIALIASLAFAGPAMAQQAAPLPAPVPAPASNIGADEALDEIVVTGSSIRGVAPIGSNLVSVGQEVLEKTAAINASQLTNTIPAITTSGSLAQGENVYSYYSPQIHSLAGSGSNTTLAIIDGLRMPGGGTQYSQTDPNIIPTPAIQRVEVLADGASSVYGSDAVAGVVNYITRRTFDGLEANVRGGLAKNYYNMDFNFIWGTKWETGGVYLTAQYNYQDDVANSQRPFASRGDYRDIGGSNNNSFSCSPATIRTPASGNNVYLTPGSTTTVANNQANSPCNTSIYGDLIGKQYRVNGLMKATNDFGDKLTVTAMMNYNFQQTRRRADPGTLNTATVFGPGQGVPGQTNPFFLAPAGDPGAVRETVSWLALMPSGDHGIVQSQSESFYATAVAEYRVTDKWTATLSDAYGKNRSALDTINGFCTSCALLALNGTGQLSGSTTTTDVAGQNVIALNLPLTTANALDVWSPLGSSGNRTSQAVLNALYGSDSQNVNYNTFNQTKLDVQGTLFSLPAGDVRMAVGAEYLIADLEQKINGQNGTGPSATGSSYRFYQYHRTVKSAYAEVVIPLVSPEMEVPLVHRLDINVSGRYDDYSDVGSTSNPKIAANWEIVSGIKLRGNYATAFVAPPLAGIGDPSQGYLYASGSVGTAGSLFVPIAAYPEVVNVPGAVCTATTCNIGLGNNPGMRRQLGGGFVNIKPQTGNSWSVGIDLAPTFLPGFRAAVTLWNNKFEGGATSPNPNSIVNSAGLRDLLTICPTGCTQQQINDFANLAGGATISGAVPEKVYYLIDQTFNNVLNLKVQGIDAQVDYRLETGIGNFSIGTGLTYFTKFDQNFGGGEWFSVLNTSGYNTTFPSIQFKNRANFGWEKDGLSADLYWNHTGGYRNWSNTSVTPITTDAAGNPTGGGDKVKGNDTFDLHLQYSFRGGFMDGWQVYLDGQNIFDKDPPFYNGNTSGIIGGAFGYNAFVSNPLGRVVSFGLRAKF